MYEIAPFYKSPSVLPPPLPLTLTMRPYVRLGSTRLPKFSFSILPAKSAKTSRKTWNCAKKASFRERFKFHNFKLDLLRRNEQNNSAKLVGAHVPIKISRHVGEQVVFRRFSMLKMTKKWNPFFAKLRMEFNFPRACCAKPWFCINFTKLNAPYGSCSPTTWENKSFFDVFPCWKWRKSEIRFFPNYEWSSIFLEHVVQNHDFVSILLS